MRYNGLDWLRAIAAFGIVGCHLNLAPTTGIERVLLRFCDMNVGVFGCISGFLLAKSVFESNDMEVRALLLSKIRRLVPVYLVWTVFYIVVGALFDIITDGKLGPKFFELSFWGSAVFNGGASCHLWYLSALVYGSVIFVPVLFVVRNYRRRFACFAFTGSLALIWMSYSIHGNFWFYTVRLFSYLLLGISIYNLRKYVSRIPLELISALYMVAMLFSIYMPVWPHHFVPDYICATFLFIIFSRSEWRPTAIGKWLGATSFGVYLIHPVFTAMNAVLLQRIIGCGRIPIVLCDWICAWLFSMIFASLVTLVPIINRYCK